MSAFRLIIIQNFYKIRKSLKILILEMILKMRDLSRVILLSKLFKDFFDRLQIFFNARVIIDMYFMFNF